MTLLRIDEGSYWEKVLKAKGIVYQYRSYCTSEHRWYVNGILVETRYGASNVRDIHFQEGIDYITRTIDLLKPEVLAHHQRQEVLKREADEAKRVNLLSFIEENE